MLNYHGMIVTIIENILEMLRKFAKSLFRIKNTAYLLWRQNHQTTKSLVLPQKENQIRESNSEIVKSSLDLRKASHMPLGSEKVIQPKLLVSKDKYEEETFQLNLKNDYQPVEEWQNISFQMVKETVCLMALGQESLTCRKKN